MRLSETKSANSETPKYIKAGDLAGKKVLFIAYFFPPTVSTGVPGSQRTVKFLRNLSNGECHVLTVPNTVSDRENALNHLTLPVNDETIHRVAPWDLFKAMLSIRKRIKGFLVRVSFPTKRTTKLAASETIKSTFRNAVDSQDIRSTFQKLKDFIYDLCYFPDQAGPWTLPASHYGKKLVRQENIDVIFATGSPWSGLVTGYLISKATGKPLIVDFRDPWIDNPFHQSKGQYLDSLARRLERKVVTHASAVSLNTLPLRDAFLDRYPEIDPNRFFVLPNGFDALEETSELSLGSSAKEILTLCHTGFLYGVRDPAPVLDAIRDANRILKNKNKQIRFIQVGAINLNYAIQDQFKDLIEAGTLIIEGKLSHQECLQVQSQADILVNIQPFTKTQVPSKLYEYLAHKKAIFNVTPIDGALGKVVIEDDLGALFEDSDSGQLTAKLVELAIDKSLLDYYVPKNIEKYQIDTVATLLARQIIKVSKSHKNIN